MKKQKCITFLQETHCTRELENTWKQEWGADIIFSYGSSNSKGVAILLPKQADYTILNKEVDNDGRFIIIEIKYENEIYVLINIYAPTQNHENEQIHVINKIRDSLAPYEGGNIILGGDLNLALNPLKDKKGGSTTTLTCNKYRTELLALTDALNLTDIWRMKNGETFLFTWHNKKKQIFSRLDYWLLSEHLINNVKKTDIIPNINSDHSCISLHLISSFNTKRGPSYWKFNTRLLLDKDYVKFITQIIRNSAQYHDNQDKNIKWELIKMEIRNATISYSINKKKKDTQHENELLKKLKNLHSAAAINNTNKSLLEEITTVEHELHLKVARRRIGWKHKNKQSLKKRNNYELWEKYIVIQGKSIPTCMG